MATKPLDETSDFFDIDRLQHIDELQSAEEIIDMWVWDIQSSESKINYIAGHYHNHQPEHQVIDIVNLVR